MTVFIPFYNETAPLLLRALDALDAQNYPRPIQVVIVDDGSTNDTAAWVRDWLGRGHRHDFRLDQRKTNGGRKGLALDHALHLGMATGEVHVIVDSYTVVDRGCLETLVDTLWSNERYAAVCGFLRPSNRHATLLAGKLPDQWSRADPDSHSPRTPAHC